MTARSKLAATLTASLVATVGLSLATVLGLFFLAADWKAGNGGGGLLAAVAGYQALLLALPIAGLIVMDRQRRLAVILQWTWVLAALPLLSFVAMSAIPPS